MSIHWNIIQYSDSFIPSLVELVKLGTVEIIEAGGVEAACVDVVQVHDNIRVAEVKLLV